MKVKPLFSSDEQVLQWLWQVARRADEKGRTTKGLRGVDRQVWLRAECEVFERVNAEMPLMPAD